MRINAINLLMKQPEAQLAASIRRLLSDKNAERRLAGLDMMKSIRNVDFLKDSYQKLLSTVREIQKPNAKEKILIESLIGDGTEQSPTSNYTRENGFGLYDPALEVSLPPITPDAGFNVKKAFEFIRLGKAKAIFDKLNKYIEKHKEDEFTDKYGEVRLVGNSVLLNWYKHYDGLSELGLPELWLNFYQQEIGSYDKLLMMKFMLASTGAPNEIEEDEDDEFDEEEQEDKEAAIQSLNTFEPLINKMYAGFTYRGLQKSLRKLTYYRQIEDIIDGLAHEYRNEATYQQFSVNMLLQLLPLLNTKNIFPSIHQ